MIAKSWPSSPRIDLLIAEAKRLARRRRLATLAIVLMVGLSAGLLVGVRLEGSGRTVPGTRAGLRTYARYWWGHGRGLDIRRSGIGRERILVHAAPSYYVTMAFEVIEVTGSQTAADARIRVVRAHNADGVVSQGPIRVGRLGDLRLRRGVVTDSITHATYCAPRVDKCGL